MLPIASLRIENYMSNPPKPISCGVFIDNKIVAIVPLDELKSTFRRLEELEKIWVSSASRRFGEL